MIEIIEKAQCTGCHACVSVCPKQCVAMVSDSEGFLYPQADQSMCVDCGLCEKVCPVSHLPAGHPVMESVGAINKDEAVRLASSSGGLFTLLAQQVLNKGGAVFGAAMTEDCYGAAHLCVQTMEDLHRLQGSKYVQSTIGRTYEEVKTLLDQGTTVLFSGTPCQIAGLRSYLGKPCDHLLTADMVCHGVPSPGVWMAYVQMLEQKYHSKVTSVSFRHKALGWKKYSLEVAFENGTCLRHPARDDLYMRGFLSGLYLRPSCHDCRFKSLARQGDLTLADFWGVEHMLPEVSDDRGISLVFANTETGCRMLDAVKAFCRLETVNTEQAVSYNMAAVRSASANPRREAFLRDLHRRSHGSVFRAYCSLPMAERIKAKIKKIIR